MILGVTGHRVLQAQDAWQWVRTELARFISGLPRPLVALSSLAIGADQIFAELVLAQQGRLEAIIPFPDYERTFETERDLQNYRRLRDSSAAVMILEPSESDEAAYLRAGKLLVERSELLLAVWDGMPGHGKGGTSDIVKYAIVLHKPWIHFNPMTREISNGGEST